MDSNEAPNSPAESDREDSPPRELSTAEPKKVFGDEFLLEEEMHPWFKPEKWYPVRMGEVIDSRYQVLAKLGFGSVSTVWLCRDLRRSHKYVSLKIYYTGHPQAAKEVEVSRHLESVIDETTWPSCIRKLRRSFEIPGAVGPHVCLVYDPLLMSIEDVRLQAGGKLPTYILKPFMGTVLSMLGGLHTNVQLIHTDLWAGNVLSSAENESVWDEIVEKEWTTPSPRKIRSDRTIYASHTIGIQALGDQVVICDFGEARVGDGPFIGDVMPDLYRAPEIILYIPWTEKIDIWSVGLMTWDLLEGKHLFSYPNPGREDSRGAHVARIVSLLGKPPKDFLERTTEADEFFDEDGNLKIQPEGVEGGSLEEEEEVLEADDKKKFFWRPEDRPTAEELANDPCLEV
ncbi:putative Serine/threonine protein kinase [Diplogelasinospora grovesii]|uniref:non-specific serine/threonine protein kinase n=1 Tax=Diplogelasinospora grovesii TaxID=303347 RepID=A0AAN6S529_9PEZI|nr:putative Serine/threonine protein kinase [Diplogelasinospora grovesii]